MLEEPWEIGAVNVTHATLLDQRDEEPEGKDLAAVEEKLRDNKVHALHVAHFSFVHREGCQHTAKFLVAIST